MKTLLMALLALTGTTAFAATDAQVVGAVFNDPTFVRMMGETSVNEIQVTQNGRMTYTVIVNARAPMVDGCAYSATVSERFQRPMAGPRSIGPNNMLIVSNTSRKCGMRPMPPRAGTRTRRGPYTP